jgi:hypothetical protein
VLGALLPGEVKVVAPPTFRMGTGCAVQVTLTVVALTRFVSKLLPEHVPDHGLPS